MSLNPPTVYMPMISPPTPAPSPGPNIHVLPQIASVSASSFSSLAPFQRRQFLASILAECNQEELLFVSTSLSLRLRRDFLRDLPPEIAVYILSFIDDPKTLLRAGRVSRYWHSLVADEWLWKQLCMTYNFEVEEDWERGSNSNIPPNTSFNTSEIFTSMGKHRARHSTGSIPLLGCFAPRKSYRHSFKLSYLNRTSQNSSS